MAIAVIRYRPAHGVSAGPLADPLAFHDGTVATLEDGDVHPDVGLLRLLPAYLGLRLPLDIHPEDHAGTEITYAVA